jgi:hypothetical protein
MINSVKDVATANGTAKLAHGKQCVFNGGERPSGSLLRSPQSDPSGFQDELVAGTKLHRSLFVSLLDYQV